MKPDTDTQLDAADRRILQALQRDARLSVQELADLTGMSPSPCWRRAKALRNAGVIRGEAALVDRRRAGMTSLAYIHLSLVDHREATNQRLEGFALRHDRIVECATITGADDDMIKVMARDPEDLERFLMKELLALAVVRSSTTHSCCARPNTPPPCRSTDLTFAKSPPVWAPGTTRKASDDRLFHH